MLLTLSALTWVLLPLFLIGGLMLFMVGGFGAATVVTSGDDSQAGGTVVIALLVAAGIFIALAPLSGLAVAVVDVVLAVMSVRRLRAGDVALPVYQLVVSALATPPAAGYALAFFLNGQLGENAAAGSLLGPLSVACLLLYLLGFVLRAVMVPLGIIRWAAGDPKPLG